MTSSFAIFGAEPAFADPLPVGQLYFPSWDRYVTSCRGIFDRQYYTNQGPLVEDLEDKLQDFLRVKHAICVTNATIGLMITTEALGLTGKVILPAFTFIASAQSLTWAGLEPVFCDINLSSHQIDIDKIEALIDDDVCAIMGVNLWGGACNPVALSKLANEHDLKLYFDSAHSFGCKVDDVQIGNYGDAEVFSFHATKILSATEGGCICTNDSDLAERMRNIRSSYGARTIVNVPKTGNGRMSEAQAAIALLSLEDFPENQMKNEHLFRAYKGLLELIPGLTLVEPHGVSFSNYQYLVCSVDKDIYGLSRDLLLELLKAENIYARRYFYPGIHRSVPYVQQISSYQDRMQNTDALCESCIQFPIGASVSVEDVERICRLLDKAHHASSIIKKRYEQKI